MKISIKTPVDKLVISVDGELVMLERDGDAWCAHDNNFINLVESEHVFAPTIQLALDRWLESKSVAVDAFDQSALNKVAINCKRWLPFTIKPLFAWYDMWLGCFWDKDNRKLYVLPLPCVGFVLQFK